jgi:hypothetical protein
MPNDRIVPNERGREPLARLPLGIPSPQASGKALAAGSWLTEERCDSFAQLARSAPKPEAPLTLRPVQIRC